MITETSMINFIQQFLDEEGCPRCSSKSCFATGCVKLTVPGLYEFVCDQCQFRGDVVQLKFPDANLSSNEWVTVSMMERMGEDVESYLKRIGKYINLGKVGFTNATQEACQRS